jgi:DNA polymerase III sliding clamp (beta) subunit (PCNA family)
VAAEFSGEESAIAFSPQYLLDGLAAALTAAAGAPAPGPAAADADGSAKPDRDGTPVAAPGRIRLQFTSPTKPALITGSPQVKAAGEMGGEPAPDYRYLVVPLRALTSA